MCEHVCSTDTVKCEVWVYTQFGLAFNREIIVQAQLIVNFPVPVLEISLQLAISFAKIKSF